MVFGLLQLVAEPGLRSDSDLGALPNLEHLVAKVAKWYHQTWDKGSELSTWSHHRIDTIISKSSEICIFGRMRLIRAIWLRASGLIMMFPRRWWLGSSKRFFRTNAPTHRLPRAHRDNDKPTAALGPVHRYTKCCAHNDTTIHLYTCCCLFRV